MTYDSQDRIANRDGTAFGFEAQTGLLASAVVRLP